MKLDSQVSSLLIGETVALGLVGVVGFCAGISSKNKTIGKLENQLATLSCDSLRKIEDLEKTSKLQGNEMRSIQEAVSGLKQELNHTGEAHRQRIQQIEHQAVTRITHDLERRASSGILVLERR